MWLTYDVFGCGFLWWLLRAPRFRRYGGYVASGVGNQMAFVLPELDVVMVQRDNTDARERRQARHCATSGSAGTTVARGAGPA